MKKIIIPAFFILLAAQLYVPASMIMERENVIDHGEVYLFKTAPIDPRDPFRGQYIRLNFDEDSYVPKDISRFDHGQDVFVHIKKNDANIVKVVGVSYTKPNKENYLKVKISNISNDRIYFEYPFTRFYMEESKAAKAENALRQITGGERKKAYAKVYVLQGQSVLTDVIVEGKSIKLMGE